MINIQGFAFTSRLGPPWQAWLHLLQCHTVSYAPQPYQHEANILKAAGHDRDARRVLIAQQQDLLQRGDVGGWFATSKHWLWGKLGGYGYKAGRLTLALLVVLLLSGATGWWAGHWVTRPGQHAAQHTKASTQSGTTCSTIEQIGLGIDRGLPIGATGIRTYCDLDTATTAGQYFTLGLWVLQAMIWALATLAVVGYTGLIRKIT